MTFSTAGGRLLRAGQPFLALGVNHLPSRAGCRMWSEWDPDALRADFAAMAGAGLNTVRLFLFWRDLEPEPGGPDEERLRRVRHAVELAGEHGLACVLSLLTIWMNGQRLDVPWRRGRSLWRDPEMLEGEERYARAVARTVRDLDNVLALDLGDEVANVDPRDSASLSPAEVRAWYRRLAGAIRDEAPHLLVMQANDTSGVLGASPFGPDNGEPLDLAAVHGFPAWAPGHVESTVSFKATNLVPFLVRYAGAFGVPLVDELGSYGADDAVSAAYLGAAGASAIAGGASGLIVWCWQDIAAADDPYRERPGERSVGLTRLDGSHKPQLEAYRRLAAAGDLARFERDRAPVALYLPERVRAAGDSYLDAGAGTTAVLYAHLLLTRAHLPFDVVHGDLDGYALAVCPSVRHLTLCDRERLAAHAERGGTVYLSLGSHLHGFPGPQLAGVEVVDFSLLTEPTSWFTWDGECWPLDWEAGGARPATLRAIDAEVLAAYRDGSPAVTAHRAGRGQVVLCGAPLEAQLDRPGRLEALPWERLYRRIAALAGVTPPISCACPSVEVVAGRVDGCRAAVAINHGSAAVGADLAWSDRGRARSLGLVLEGKGWQVVPLT